MGYHFLPQYYLKGFTDDPKSGMLWQFEKGTGKAVKANVKSLAKINKLYSEELEQHLANEVEGPANEALDKIRSQQPIGDEEKGVFAEYMVAMWKRVPQMQNLMKERAPHVSNDVSKQFDEFFNRWIDNQPENAEFIEKQRKEKDDLLAIWAESPPKEMWWQNIPPEKTPKIVEGIRKMSWAFLNYGEHPAFFTCDNPVFFLNALLHKDSEVSFPISSHFLLFATWEPGLSNKIIDVPIQIVKEMNRRTARNAQKYIYHCRKEHWIPAFIKKGKWKINKLM